MNINFSPLADELKTSVDNIEKAIELLDDGNTIPFITRFRKDATGGLNEKQLLRIQQVASRLKALEERRSFVIRTIESQDKLSDKLREQITSATSLREIEDAYLPFKPRKQSLATTARQAGLEPFAQSVLEGEQSIEALAEQAVNFVRVDKNIASTEEVFDGVGHIIAEEFSNDGELRAQLREIFWNTGRLVSTRIEEKPVADVATEPSESAHTEVASKPTEVTTTASMKPAEGPAESAPLVAVAPEPATTDSEPADATPETELTSPESTTSGQDSNSVAPTSDSTEKAPPAEVVSSPEPDAPSASENTSPGPGTASANNEEVSDSEPGSGESTDSDSTSQTEATTAEATTAEAEPSTPASTDPDSQTPQATESSPSSVPCSEPKAKKKKRKKKKKKAEDPFKDFHDFNEALNKLPFHRTLAINRGERSGVLRVRVTGDDQKMRDVAVKKLVSEGHQCAEFLNKCVADAMQRLILPSLEREIRRELTENAEKHAVEVFSSNLKHLLLQRPTSNRSILAIDPGFKRGCSVAILDASGNFLASDHLFVVGNKTRREQSIERLKDLIEKHKIDLIAIGNGTACRETEQVVSTLINEKLPSSEIRYVMVNEAGASVYSTSEVGREEFPDVSPNVRSAISIGRRLIDPLSELVKIAPANIGVGMYQHDVKAKHLAESLDQTVEFCVNRVGVNVNTASPSLLRYVSGLNQLTAHRIFEYRKENGPFQNREALKNVTGFGQATFVQAAGFLRIHDGDQPLDSTSIHPESYEIAKVILDRTNTETNVLFPPPRPKPSGEKTEASAQPGKGSVESQPPQPQSTSTEPTSSEGQTVSNPAVAEAQTDEPTKDVSTDAEKLENAVENTTNPVAAVSDESPGETPSIQGNANEKVDEQVDEKVDEKANDSSVTEEVTAAAPAPTAPEAATSEVAATDPAQTPATEADQKSTDPQDASTSQARVTLDPAQKAALEKVRVARMEAIGRIKELNQIELAGEFKVGRLLVKDIVNNLIRPKRDPREGVSRPIFRRGIIKVDDLKPGMMLDGQVVNVVDFGVFVDIGLGESSLVHVSQLSNRYIQDPHQHFSVGEVIKVWVSEIEAERRRVKLTAINPSAPRKDSRRKPKTERPAAGKRSTQRRDRKRTDKGSSKVKATRTRRTPKPVQPITQEMLDGKKPMRSFSDLLQFVEKQTDDKKKKN